MKPVKPKLLVFSVLFLSLNGIAQLKIPITNNDLRVNLQKVIADFPNHLASLMGDTIEVNPQSIEYASRLDFKTATDNFITQYKSAKPVSSWKATFLDTEEFAEAVKKYKWLCKELKVMTITLDNGYSFTLNGTYGEPDESKKFSSSLFTLTPRASNLPKIRIEASMLYEFPEWKVSLLVYEKEREDNERGETKEE